MASGQTARRACAIITPRITRRSCGIPTATGSRRCATTRSEKRGGRARSASCGLTPRHLTPNGETAAGLEVPRPYGQDEFALALYRQHLWIAPGALPGPGQVS